jgi:hypothetical protein
MKTIRSITLSALFLALSTTVSAAGLGNNIAVRLVGTNSPLLVVEAGALFEEFGIEPDPSALCYPLDLVDVKTGKVIGDAVDCLTNIDDETYAPGVALTGTTFFNFKSGTVVTQGLTTVQPILHVPNDFTHITGAIPSPGDNNVIYGDRKFHGVSGTARLSGAVNLTGFPGSATFDCVFILDFSR